VAFLTWPILNHPVCIIQDPDRQVVEYSLQKYFLEILHAIMERMAIDTFHMEELGNSRQKGATAALQPLWRSLQPLASHPADRSPFDDLRPHVAQSHDSPPISSMTLLFCLETNL
jgi:hypothetical protein